MPIMKIPVFCSLIPTELLVHLGCEPVYLDAEGLKNTPSREYHCAFHENICSYSKVLYDYLLENQNKFDFMIIPASCDAMKKLYNALKQKLPGEKLHFFDMPRCKDGNAAKFLAAEMKKVVDLSAFAISNPAPTGGVGRGQEGSDSPKLAPKLAVLGSNVPLKIFRTCAEKFGFEITLLNHCLSKARPDEKLLWMLQNNDLAGYAGAFLEKNSCPRTNDDRYKETLVKQVREGKFKGMIINTLKFCDFQPFDYIWFKNALEDDLPMLMIEHELTTDNEGQIMTRLEAFFENIQKKLGLQKKRQPGNSGRFYVGIDSGSHATKLVCVDGEENLIASLVVNTGTSVKKSVEKLLEQLKTEYKITKKDIGRMVATGYGRNNITDADDVVTEISCHARGAYHLTRKGGTIIDIGGQDSKAIRLDDKGGVARFAMNDKCAAGTGRFLEVMAAKLEMSLEEFASLAQKASRSVPISSMCSVFAESEVISLIASGVTKESIAKGIHKSIAERTIALAKRIEGAPPYFMTGGVAKNKGLVGELEECLGHKLDIVENPQFSGALGAALIALRG